MRHQAHFCSTALDCMRCSVKERDLRGRICLVTGANKGLGLAIAKDLARRGCTLYMVCRSEERGKEAVDKVRQEADNRDVHLKVCDMSSLAAISALAQDLEAKQTRLYLLVNNAGVMVCTMRAYLSGAGCSLHDTRYTRRMQPCCCLTCSAKFNTVRC
jgi:NAD(P)-dependent dehydrogenase (short-subunit alcohol dehydrogenase family)